MNREIYIHERFWAAAEDGALMEYIPRDDSESAGEIVLGKAERLMAGMNSAFVDIGRKRSGFLPLTEGSRSFEGNTIRSGDSVIVQIKKEEFGEKGAYLTRDISLPGRYALLMPMNRHIGISSRVQDPETRERLRKTGEDIAQGEFGLIMRAAAAEARAEEVEAEVSALMEEWRKAEALATAVSAPRVLRKRQDAGEQMISDYAARGGVAQVYRGKELTPDLERQLRSAGQRKVRLNHGGNLVIDRCEAMTVIDINTAGDTAGRSPEDIFRETNLEACGEIVRQVRLRNLSGVILIDFINTQKDSDRSLILEALTQGFDRDRVKTVIHGFTSLGLMEMTRKRSRPDWYEQQTECCAACGGTGRVLKDGRNGGKA